MSPFSFNIFFSLLITVSMVTACKVNETPGKLSCTLNDGLLMDVKKAVSKNNPDLMPLFNSLVKEAESYFNVELLSVVDKEKLPPSGDKRDYISLSPYWWPNPDTEDGLPYVQRDGKRNPEVYDYPERENTQLLSQMVETLGVLYYITGEERYAQRASEFLRRWFINTETAMNPNMMYAQIRPGISEIRGTGIIDSRRLIGAFNGAKLIEGSENWTRDDEEKLKNWTRDFVLWLESSPHGQLENKAGNNHGVWYDAIILSLVYYNEDYEKATQILKRIEDKRLSVQQDSDGSFPRELTRTISLHYSTFVLQAFIISAEIGRKLDHDLWASVPEDGKSLKKGIEFLFPFLTGSKPWPHPQIEPYDFNEGAMLLYKAGLALNEPMYLNAAKKIGSGNKPDVQTLLYYRINH